MSSNHENVTLPGRLVGAGRAVECSVCLVKVSLPGTAIFEYIHPIIHDAPADLPDGFYDLTFGGKAEKVQRQRGAWIAPVA
jgi:hypothetical protein